MTSLTDLSFAAPELFVLTMTCVVLIVDLFLTERNRWISYYLALLTLLGAAFITVHFAVDQRVLAFEGMFVADRLSDILKLAIYLVIGVVFVYSKEYLQRRVLFKGEYFVLSLTGMLGMMVMISAHSFLSMYLGLELMSLSLYAMVAFDRDSGIASEAAMKYFVLGGIASGTLLFGISILYGVTGSLDFSEIATALSSGHDLDLAVLFALSFVIVAVAFKLGAVPFHMWLPDVYDGAPTSVTLYLGTAPKIAGFALVVRVLVEALGQYQSDWANMLTILAVLSMAVGNLAAIAQSNIKRMLAYSTISHVGFILLGFIAGTEEGLVAALFYTLVYALMAAGAFGVIILLSRAGFEADQLE
ncbi:MAG: NADH-quinone oxidoreductase subunit N, partial [Gammaproteobacteria bacterium]